MVSLSSWSETRRQSKSTESHPHFGSSILVRNHLLPLYYYFNSNYHLFSEITILSMNSTPTRHHQTLPLTQRLIDNNTLPILWVVVVLQFHNELLILLGMFLLVQLVSQFSFDLILPSLEFAFQLQLSSDHKYFKINIIIYRSVLNQILFVYISIYHSNQFLL